MNVLKNFNLINKINRTKYLSNTSKNNTEIEYNSQQRSTESISETVNQFKVSKICCQTTPFQPADKMNHSTEISGVSLAIKNLLIKFELNYYFFFCFKCRKRLQTDLINNNNKNSSCLMANNFDEQSILDQHNPSIYPFYLVDIHLICGKNLLAKDNCGTSDPYVKFKLFNHIIYKSQIIYKTLNPIWDEYFVIPIENIHEPIIIKVYDFDYLSMDDFMGSAAIDLSHLTTGTYV